mgnify:CR=1 FL=1
MTKTGYAQRIRARAEELRKIIADAQSELAELDVAERVIERLSSDQDDDQDVALRSYRRTREPTIADMAVKFLGEFGPMATAQLLDHMRENWREDLGSTTLTSTLSRTKNAGRIDYRDGLWRAVEGDHTKKDEPPEGGPQKTGEVAASPDPGSKLGMPGIFTDAYVGSQPAPRSGGEGGD